MCRCDSSSQSALASGRRAQKRASHRVTFDTEGPEIHWIPSRHAGAQVHVAPLKQKAPQRSVKINLSPGGGSTVVVVVQNDRRGSDESRAPSCMVTATIASCWSGFWRLLKIDEQQTRGSCSPRSTSSGKLLCDRSGESRQPSLWRVVLTNSVRVRASKSGNASTITTKSPGDLILGIEENGWLRLTEEEGFVTIRGFATNVVVLEPVRQGSRDSIDLLLERDLVQSGLRVSRLPRSPGTSVEERKFGLPTLLSSDDVTAKLDSTK